MIAVVMLIIKSKLESQKVLLSFMNWEFPIKLVQPPLNQVPELAFFPELGIEAHKQRNF